jgi:hypothetical protein
MNTMLISCSYDTKNETIARIPLDGHPENKYFVSKAAAAAASYVMENMEDKKFLVRYDSLGKTGPPIIQPNKYEYLQRIGYRLGRDIWDITELLSKEQKVKTIYRLQNDALERAIDQLLKITAQRLSKGEKNTSLKKLAWDLHKVAPDLAEEVGIKVTDEQASLTEQQAAQLLNMQIIQETNNRWETLFPKSKNIWSFAPAHKTIWTMCTRTKHVVSTKQHQFFSMRKWPPTCNSGHSQEERKHSGLEHQSKPESLQPLVREELQQEETDQPRNRPGEIHTGRGQRPFYPLGESRYSQRWLSLRMEDDLRRGTYSVKA